jgi:Cu-Zn family superoxide dismutase
MSYRKLPINLLKIFKVAGFSLLACSSSGAWFVAMERYSGDSQAIAEVIEHRAMPSAIVNISAIANIFDAKGKPIGTASFRQTKEGVQVNLQVRNLAKGAHMVHIHEHGKCDAPDFSTAGNHFAPQPQQMHHHSVPHHQKHDQKHNDSQPMHSPHHQPAGDLPNIMVNADGIGSLQAVLPDLTLGMGANSLLKEGGTAILIHAGADGISTIPNVDYKTRIACGVVKSQ